VKRPTMLVQAMLRQLSLDLDLSVERDLQRIADRCKHEGLSFLTITLPQLSDAGRRQASFAGPGIAEVIDQRRVVGLRKKIGCTTRNERQT
jgi:hypothetical protein